MFDPGDDRNPQFVTRCPVATVEDDLLRQGLERFHRSVVTSGCNADHRSRQLIGLEHSDEFPGAELGPPVRKNDDGADR